MKRILSGSFFRMVAVSTGLAVLPLICVLFFTGSLQIEQAGNVVSEKSVAILHSVIKRQQEAHDNIRIMLEGLSETQEFASGDRQAMEGLMGRLVRAMSDYDQLALYDQRGRVVANAGGQERALDPFFFQTSPGGADFFAGFVAGGLPFYTYAIFDAQDHYHGLLAVFAGQRFYRELLAPLELDPAFSVYFLDNGGQGLLRYSGGNMGPVEERDLELLSSFLAKHQAGEAHEVQSAGEAGRIMAAYSLLRTGNDDLSYLTVVLTYTFGRGQLLEETWAFRAMLLTIFGIAGTLALLWLVCVVVFKLPLKRLLSVAARLGKGDFQARRELNYSFGAFKDFASALHSMAEKLEAHEEELRAARDEALRSGRSKSEFLANMSHEIRTPLNAILGMTYLVLKSDLNAAQRGYVSKIQTASKNLLHVINDILDFSKMEAGKMGFEQIRFAIRETFGNVQANYSSRAAESGLRLDIDVAPAVPLYLVGDPLRLEQALGQLLEYSFKHTWRGSIRLSCELASLNGGECALRFVVADTGEGLDDQELERLRQAFAAVSGGASPLDPGAEGEGEARQEPLAIWNPARANVDLGLTISRRLFELMNGTVEVSSELGAGTVFTCLARFGYNSADQQRSSPFLAGNRILLVDSDPSSLALYSGMLKNFSMDVQALSSGKEALDSLSLADFNGEPFDFLMFDARNLELDGAELIVRVKQDLGLGKVPLILATSGMGRNELRKRSEDAGADVFLHKPIDASVLLDTLMGLYGGGGEDRMDDLAEALRGRTPDKDGGNIFAGLRVLLVEDNLLNQQLAKELMEQQEVEVSLAASGKEALSQIAASRRNPPFDIVLMDLQMPEMDGFEATWRIRNDKHLNSVFVPIIAMTAHSNPEEIGACYKAGMDDYAAKPIDVDLFFKALARWLPIPPDRDKVAVAEVTRLASLVRARAPQAQVLLFGLQEALGLLVGEGRRKKLHKLLSEKNWEEASQFLDYLGRALYGEGWS